MSLLKCYGAMDRSIKRDPFRKAHPIGFPRHPGNRKAQSHLYDTAALSRLRCLQQDDRALYENLHTAPLCSIRRSPEPFRPQRERSPEACYVPTLFRLLAKQGGGTHLLWFGRNRHLAKGFENLAETLATVVSLTSIQLVLRRLAKEWVNKRLSWRAGPVAGGERLLWVR